MRLVYVRLETVRFVASDNLFEIHRTSVKRKESSGKWNKNHVISGILVYSRHGMQGGMLDPHRTASVSAESLSPQHSGSPLSSRKLSSSDGGNTGWVVVTEVI